MERIKTSTNDATFVNTYWKEWDGRVNVNYLTLDKNAVVRVLRTTNIDGNYTFSFRYNSIDIPYSQIIAEKTLNIMLYESLGIEITPEQLQKDEVKLLSTGELYALKQDVTTEMRKSKYSIGQLVGFSENEFGSLDMCYAEERETYEIPTPEPTPASTKKTYSQKTFRIAHWVSFGIMIVGIVSFIISLWVHR